MSSHDGTRASPGTDLLQQSAHHRRASLIDTTVLLLDAPGSRPLSLEALARAASAPSGLVDHYFPSLGSLLCEVVCSVMDDLGEQVLPYLDLPVDQAAPEVVAVFHRWSLLHTNLVREVLAASDVHHELRGAFSEVRRQVLRLLLNQVRVQDIESAPDALLRVAADWLDTVTRRLLDVVAKADGGELPIPETRGGDEQLGALLVGLDQVVAAAARSEI